VAPEPERPYTEEVGADPGRLRIAIATDPGIDYEVAPELVEAVEDVGRLLDQLGHHVDHDQPQVRELGVDLMETFTARWAAGQAELAATLAMVLDREFAADDFEPLTWALIGLGRSITAPDYLRAVSAHQMITRFMAGWWQHHDLMLSPTLGELPVPLGTLDEDPEDPLATFRRAAQVAGYCPLLNVTGQPAISLPLAHDRETGLPIGVQLVAAYGREDVLIRIACQLEQARPWARRRPPVFAG
jgi:amidase